MVLMRRTSSACRLVAFLSMVVGLVHSFVLIPISTWQRLGGGSTSFAVQTRKVPCSSRQHDLILLLSRTKAPSFLRATDTDMKEALLSYLSTINDDEIRLPCGLDCTDKERDKISQRIAALEQEPSNLVKSRNQGKIEAKDLLGEWELLYTSSRTMVINKSLSGLGRSSSDLAKFAGLRQKFTGSKFLGYIEFIEQMGTGPDALQVSVTGEWLLEPEKNPLTGEPGTAIRAELETIAYGPTSNAAKDWNSLGPVRLVDILYLDDDLQISRGNVNTESVFVYQRSQ